MPRSALDPGAPAPPFHALPGDVVLLSDVPPSHRAKRVVEEALVRTLRGLGGRWHAEVLLASAPAWWTISLVRDGESASGLLILLGPGEQTADRVEARVREALSGNAPPR